MGVGWSGTSVGPKQTRNCDVVYRIFTALRDGNGMGCPQDVFRLCVSRVGAARGPLTHRTGLSDRSASETSVPH